MCELFGIEPDTLRIRFTKLHRAGHADFPERWRIDGELTEKQVRELLSAGERKGSEPKVAQAQAQAKEIETDTAPPAVIAMIDDAGRPNEVAPNVGPKRISLPEMWRTKLFAALAFVLVIGHAVLIWYDMGLLWSVPGKIGGGVVFAFIFSGMILMSERAEKMEEIRDNMLWAVGFLEALAIVVHRGAFSRNAAQAYAAGFGIEYIWALSAVICLCSIGATIFYQKVIRL